MKGHIVKLNKRLFHSANWWQIEMIDLLEIVYNFLLTQCSQNLYIIPFVRWKIP